MNYPFYIKTCKVIGLLDTDNYKNRNLSCRCNNSKETSSQQKMEFWSSSSKACERRRSSDDIHEFQSQWSGLCYPWPSETKAIQALTVISLLSLSTLEWALEIHSLCPTGPDLFISEPLSFSISSEEITQTQVFHFWLPFITVSLDLTRSDPLDLYTY